MSVSLRPEINWSGQLPIARVGNIRRPCRDCLEMNHVLASSQACGRACLCCCGAVRSHDARRVRVCWETKKQLAIVLQPESRDVPPRANPVTAALRSLNSPHVDHEFGTTVRLRSRRLVRLFFALVLETLVGKDDLPRHFLDNLSNKSGTFAQMSFGS